MKRYKSLILFVASLCVLGVSSELFANASVVRIPTNRTVSISSVAIDKEGTIFLENTPHGQILRVKKKALPETGPANTILSSVCVIGLIWKSLG